MDLNWMIKRKIEIVSWDRSDLWVNQMAIVPQVTKGKKPAKKSSDQVHLAPTQAVRVTLIQVAHLNPPRMIQSHQRKQTTPKKHIKSQMTRSSSRWERIRNHILISSKSSGSSTSKPIRGKRSKLQRRSTSKSINSAKRNKAAISLIKWPTMSSRSVWRPRRRSFRSSQEIVQISWSLSQIDLNTNCQSYMNSWISKMTWSRSIRISMLKSILASWH